VAQLSPDPSAYAYAFDVLAIDGDDLRALPLLERKSRLAKLLRRAKPGIRYSEHMAGNGREIFDHACRLGLDVLAEITVVRAFLPNHGDRCRMRERQ
jgi:ATP-dependent DNA ligase